MLQQDFELDHVKFIMIPKMEASTLTPLKMEVPAPQVQISEQIETQQSENQGNIANQVSFNFDKTIETINICFFRSSQTCRTLNRGFAGYTNY